MNLRTLLPCVLAFPLASTPARAQQQLLELQAADGAQSDYFGHAVDISGTIAVVGAPGRDEHCVGQLCQHGAVYAFDLTSGQLLHKLLPASPAEFSSFGRSVAISGSTVVVGDPFASNACSAGNPFCHSGAVYTFDALSGQQLVSLVPADLANYMEFGGAVASDGNLALIGAAGLQNEQKEGAAYLFDLATGQELLRLSASDGFILDGFGQAVAIDGGRAAVGSVALGAVYVFDTASGAELLRLVAEDGSPIGDSVAIDGDRLIAGSITNDDARPPEWNVESGAAYLFDLNSGQQLFKLIACDAATYDEFGRSVALDGDRALVGAHNDMTYGVGVPRSAVYVFDAYSGQQIEVLEPSNGSELDGFGTSVALEAGLGLVGAEYGDGVVADAGTAYLFTTDVPNPVPCDAPTPAAGIHEAARLSGASALPGDMAGTSVALGAGLAVLGSPLDDADCALVGCDSGAAYLFDSASLQPLFELRPSDVGTRHWFGESAAIASQEVLVGAPGDQQLGIQAGAVYQFDPSTGLQTRKLTAGDGQGGDRFGCSLALDGERVLIGAEWNSEAATLAGAVYVFDRASGLQLVKLTANDPHPVDSFGRCVDISGNRAIIGSRGGQPNGLFSGSAYLFNATSGHQISKLIPSDGIPGDQFGTSVAISGQLAVAGAPYATGVHGFSGAVYVFDAVSGQELRKLTAPEGSNGDGFGFSVSLEGSRVLVGALGDDYGLDAGRGQSGSAYLFDALTGQLIHKLSASNPAQETYFGWSVALAGGQALIGSPGRDGQSPLAGGAYLYATEGVGFGYCSSSANSTGQPSSLSASGSYSLADQDLTLSASNAPVAQPALFYFGPSAIALPFGDGTRCVGGNTLRLNPIVTAAAGRFTKVVDFGAHGAQLAALAPAYFQCWYRDPAAGGAGFNLSNGLELHFLP